MESIAADLAKLLAKVNRPGDFCAAGTTELFAPSLHVEGVGQIALPLLPAQATSLIATAEPAPYGRGQETVVDPSVRLTWQIAPERVRIQGRHWQRTLDTIVARVAEGLGVDELIDAEFYKLLVYDPGNFFVGHRDTEKAPGMFATLVIVLPSLSSGGELLVRHAGREVRLESALRGSIGGRIRHVLRRLCARGSAGHRRLPSDARLQSAAAATRPRAPTPDYGNEQVRVASRHPGETGVSARACLHAGRTGVLGTEGRRCRRRRRADRGRAAGRLRPAPRAADSRGRWSGPDDDDFEAGEVSERSVSLSEWRKPDGDTSALGELPVEEAAELCPPDAFADLEPDEEHFHEATGNGGASFERTYQRAALVLWPRRRLLVVLCQAGLSVTLPCSRTRCSERMPPGAAGARCFGQRRSNSPVTCDDPAQKVWVLRAVEHVRGHVDGTIRSSNVDLDTSTDRHGRPYSLICSKNQASYERSAKRRTQDLADVAALAG
jgi:hypothetical protein